MRCSAILRGWAIQPLLWFNIKVSKCNRLNDQIHCEMRKCMVKIHSWLLNVSYWIE